MELKMLGGIGLGSMEAKLRPQIMQFFLDTYELAYRYYALDAEEGSLDAFFASCKLMSVAGLDIASPAMQEQARFHADGESDEVKRAGGANAAVFHPNGTIQLYNTEGGSFVRLLKSEYPTLQPGIATVLGNSPSARSIVFALNEEGYQASQGYAKLAEASLVVVTQGQRNPPAIEEMPSANVIANFAADSPVLRQAAQARAAGYADSQDMELYRAAASFALYIGHPIDEETLSRARQSFLDKAVL